MPINYPNLPQHLTRDEVGSPDLGEAIRSVFKTAGMGMEAAYKPKTLQEALLHSQLQNKLTQGNIDMLPYRQRLLEAQTQRQSQLADQPYGGMLSGMAKEAYGIAQMTGQDPQEVAQKLYQNKLQQSDILNQYRQGLLETQGTRALSPFGKLQREEEDVMAGYEPGTNRQVQISPDRQEELTGQYQLLRQKSATDADTRKRNLLATNVEKTVDLINPKHLAAFSGIKGSAKFKSEQAKSVMAPGSESQEFQDYMEAANKAQLLAHQVRQFYGDSIQPAMLAKLEKLANPSTWNTSPQMAENLFNSFTDLLDQEMKTYRHALKSTDVFRGEERNKPGKIVTLYKNGIPHDIPETEANEAMEKWGYSRG